LNKRDSNYEKSNDTDCCVINVGADIGFLLERAGGDHHYNASDHRHDRATAASEFTNDHNNDPHGRRPLLIAEAGNFTRRVNGCRG
jgi:hypothetical protein